MIRAAPLRLLEFFAIGKVRRWQLTLSAPGSLRKIWQ